MVATQITSGLAIEKMFQQRVDPNQQVGEMMPPIDPNQLGADIARAREGGGDVSELLQRVGVWALAAKPVSETQRRDVIAARLPVQSGDRALRIVAVDVESGERMRLRSVQWG